MTILWSCTLITAEEAEPLNLLRICHFLSVVQNSDGFTEHVLCGFCSGAVKSKCCQHLLWGIFSSQWKSEVSWFAVNICFYMHLSVLNLTTPPRYLWGHCGVSIFPPTGQAVESNTAIMWDQWGLECRDLTRSPFCRIDMWNLSCACTVKNLHPWGWSHVQNQLPLSPTNALERSSGA